MSDDATSHRERLRARELAALPAWYNPWAHLGATTVICLTAVVAALVQLHGVTPWEWLTIPGVFLFSNAFEWHIHRNALHRRAPGLYYLYERHTPMHHGVFTHDTMVIRSAREMKLVLIPPLAVLAIVVLVAPLSLGLRALFSPNAGWLFLATGSAYVLIYEYTHLAYHLPPASRIGRLPFMAALRRHHTAHHDPRLMQRWNFNVSFPIFDRILGTTAPSAAEAGKNPSAIVR